MQYYPLDLFWILHGLHFLNMADGTSPIPRDFSKKVREELFMILQEPLALSDEDETSLLSSKLLKASFQTYAI